MTQAPFRAPQFTIAVYSPAGTIPKVLRDVLGEDIRMVPVDPDNWDQTDVYVSTTGLTAQTERCAAVLGAWPVILPEAAAWLRTQIAKADRPLRVFVAQRQGDRPAPKFSERNPA